MVWVKVCGVKDVPTAQFCFEQGADAIGLMFVASSQRKVSEPEARQIGQSLADKIELVGVFANQSLDYIKTCIDSFHLSCVQLHGSEPYSLMQQIPVRTIKAFSVAEEKDLQQMEAYPVGEFLLDSKINGILGGSGISFNWQLAQAAKKRGRVILAGGLHSANVRQAIEQVQPFGVDVSSGVEVAQNKSLDKIAEFIATVRRVTSTVGMEV